MVENMYLCICRTSTTHLSLWLDSNAKKLCHHISWSRFFFFYQPSALNGPGTLSTKTNKNSNLTCHFCTLTVCKIVWDSHLPGPAGREKWNGSNRTLVTETTTVTGKPLKITSCNSTRLTPRGCWPIEGWGVEGTIIAFLIRLSRGGAAPRPTLDCPFWNLQGLFLNKGLVIIPLV